MAVSNVRHNKAREASRAFLESVFTEPGTEIAFSDLTARAIKAGIASSTSILNRCCVDLTEEGFLVREKKGVYKRTDPRGTALPIPEAATPPPPPSQEAMEVLRLAGLDSRLIALDKKVDGLQTTLNQILDLLTAPK